jgi:hypothetical protein
MCANSDTVLLAFSDRFLHNQRIAGVEAAGDIGVID